MDLFVYGTSLRGQPQGGLLARYKRIPATVRGRIYQLKEGFPALTLTGDAVVYGELVVGVDLRLLRLLDRAEGVEQGLFARVPVDVAIGLRRQNAEAYVMTDPQKRGGRAIQSGRWRGSVRRGGR